MLKNGKWSKEFNRCMKCGGNDCPHHSNGLCYNCFNTKRNHDQKTKLYRKEFYRKYWLKIKENPETYKELQEKNKEAVKRYYEKKKINK